MNLMLFLPLLILTWLPNSCCIKNFRLSHDDIDTVSGLYNELITGPPLWNIVENKFVKGEKTGGCVKKQRIRLVTSFPPDMEISNNWYVSIYWCVLMS